MALTVPAVYASIVASSPYKDAKTFPWIAEAVATAFVQWVRTPTAVLLTGNATGFLGGGSTTGKLFLKASGLVAASLVGSGLNPQVATQIGNAIEQGIAESVTSSGQYLGTSIAVGTGSDVTKVQFAQQGVLLGFLAAAMAARQINGINGTRLSQSLSVGIANLTKTMTGVGAVAGANTGVAGAGKTVSYAL